MGVQMNRCIFVEKYPRETITFFYTPGENSKKQITPTKLIIGATLIEHNPIN